LKTIAEYNTSQEEIEMLKREAVEAEPCTEEPDTRGESRYKRGRRWWEQSKWERRR
jgi:hypothetical protein